MGSTPSSLIPHLQELVQEVVDQLAGVERRRVLASDGWFTRDKLFALVSKQARVIVRLPDAAAQDELLAIDGASRWQIRNRKPLRDWIELPEEMHDDRAAIGEWVTRAWSIGRAQKLKKTAAKKKRATRTRRD